MGTLQGKSGHVLGRTIPLDMHIKYLRSLFVVTGRLLHRFDTDDEDVDTLMGLVRVGHDECDALESISKEFHEIADDLLRHEQEATKA